MNWEIFSPIGYASIAMWLCIPLLWLWHAWRRRGWLIHVALLLGVAAFVLAKINSNTYVNRIQVDRSDQINEQMERQELARQAAKSAREGEVAPIRFAEDTSGDFLDAAGMDESDLKYLQSFDDDATPEWKKDKKQRTEGALDDSLESQVGATVEQDGVESSVVYEDESKTPILMSDSDKTAADRFDKANLTIIRWLLGLGIVGIALDYLRRANDYEAAYFPLPLPSHWVDAMTPRAIVTTRGKSPRRSLLEELKVFVRRGESFVLFTDNQDAAAAAATTAYRLPLRISPVEVLNVAEYNGQMDDDFVFETLWYGRNSFVVDSTERGQQMLNRFIELLNDRRGTRARVKQTVHIVWDVATPISPEMRHQFANLGRATGFTLLLSRET